MLLIIMHSISAVNTKNVATGIRSYEKESLHNNMSFSYSIKKTLTE